MPVHNIARSWASSIIRLSVAGLVCVALVVVVASPSGAATAPDLGTAANFAVLGASTVTNTGASTLVGDLGVSPGTALTGTGTIDLTGSQHAGDPVASQAQVDAAAAFADLTNEPCTQSFAIASEIGDQTLTAGVYCYASAVTLGGTLTLSGSGIFIFKAGSTLTTSVAGTVALVGGADPCNVFWQVGSSADLFPSTVFAGSIVALTSITLRAGTSIDGRAIALNAAVTMDTNSVLSSDCTATPTPTPTDTATSTPTDSATATLTNTPTEAATLTPTITNTPTATSTPTDTPTETATLTPTLTPVPTDTPTDTATATVQPTDTPTPTSSPTRTVAPTSTSVAATTTPIATNTPASTGTVTPANTLMAPTEAATETPAPPGSDRRPATAVGQSGASDGDTDKTTKLIGPPPAGAVEPIGEQLLPNAGSGPTQKRWHAHLVIVVIVAGALIQLAVIRRLRTGAK